MKNPTANWTILEDIDTDAYEGSVVQANLTLPEAFKYFTTINEGILSIHPIMDGDNVDGYIIETTYHIRFYTYAIVQNAENWWTFIDKNEDDD